MLTIFGKPERFCDGITRRNFLKIGGLAGGALSLGGATLADVLAGRSETAPTREQEIDHQHLPGRRAVAPGHVRPQARGAGEIRGEFQPITTNVPGIEICSLMPNLAKMADKFAIIRSLTGFRDEHTLVADRNRLERERTAEHRRPSQPGRRRRQAARGHQRRGAQLHRSATADAPRLSRARRTPPSAPTGPAARI